MIVKRRKNGARITELMRTPFFLRFIVFELGPFLRASMGVSAATTILLLSGCGVYQLNTRPSTAPLSSPQSTAPSGDFTHSPSGYRFPETVSGFQRVNVSQFDSAGLDVGIGYNGGTKECKVALTIYVYPAPKMSFIGAAPEVVRSLEQRWLETAYQTARRDIEASHPGAILKIEDSKMQNSIVGKKAVYQIDTAQSDLYVFLIDRMWFLKYRMSYQEKCTDQASAALDSFFAGWKGRDS